MTASAASATVDRLPEEIEGPIILAARDLVLNSRVKYGTNDVAVYAIDPRDGVGARLWCRPRAAIREAIEKTTPDAANTLASLDKAVRPDEFILVIRACGVIESMTVATRTDTTRGVLN